MMRWLPVLMALAACAPKAPVAGSDAPCGTAAMPAFVGKPYTAALGETMRTATGARTIRALSPDAMATTDFRPERLTIQLDEAGRVSGADCG